MKENIGKNAIKLTISKIITMAIALISAMLLSRFRTLEEYGTYSQILLVVNLISSLIMLGLPNSINYFLSRADTDEQRNKFLSVYYTLSTVLGIIVGLVLVSLVPFIVKYFENDLLKSFIYVFAIYPWAKVIMSSIDNVLIVYKKTSLIMIYKAANSIALLAIILAVRVLNWDFRAYMILFILVESVFATSVYMIVKRIATKVRVRFDISLVRDVLTFSIPIGLASVVGTLNIELDKLMIGKFLDTKQLAIYTNASKEIPVTIIAISLTAVLMPQLVRLLKNDKNESALNLWGCATVISYIIICFFAAGFFTFAPDVMTLLYSTKYLPGVPIFRVYSIVLLLRCTYFGMIISAKGKTSFIFFSSLLSLILNIILNYILFYILGVIGPAIATVLSLLAINLMQLIFTAKITKVTISKVFPWRALGIITIVNVIFSVIFYHVKLLVHLESFLSELSESILIGILWGLLYLFLYFKEIKKRWVLLNEFS